MVRCSEDRILENAKPEYERAVAAGAAHARGAVYRDQRRGGWWDLLAARAGGTVGGCCGGAGLPGSRLRGRTKRTRSFAEVSTMYDRTCGPLVYADEAMGKMAGFTVGWMVWLLSPNKTGTAAGVRLREVQIPFLGNRASGTRCSRKLRTHEDCSTPYPELSIPRPLSSPCR